MRTNRSSSTSLWSYMKNRSGPSRFWVNNLICFCVQDALQRTVLTDIRAPVSCCIETRCRVHASWDSTLFVPIFYTAIQGRVKALYFSDLPKHMRSQLRGCRAGGGDCLRCRWFVIRWGSLWLAVCCWANHWCGKGSWISHIPRMILVILVILLIDPIEGLWMLLLNSQQF